MEELTKEPSRVAATVDGLDELFETVEDIVTPVTGDTNSTEELTTDAVIMWTLQEAAEHLGVSTRTVLRKLKSGRLDGHKVSGTNGPEWRITPITTPDKPDKTVTPSVKPVISDSGSTNDKTSDTTIQTLLKVIESQSEQLKAASEVIMYQQNQLTERDSRLKLLEDQSHTPWWSRAWQWFTGSSVT